MAIVPSYSLYAPREAFFVVNENFRSPQRIVYHNDTGISSQSGRFEDKNFLWGYGKAL